MGLLRQGDEGFHYSDHSHRWIAPSGISQDAWEAGLRAHLAQHRSAATSQEIPRQSPRNGAQVVETGRPPRMREPEPPASKDSRKPRPRSQVGARRRGEPAFSDNGHMTPRPVPSWVTL